MLAEMGISDTRSSADLQSTGASSDPTISGTPSTRCFLAIEAPLRKLAWIRLLASVVAWTACWLWLVRGEDGSLPWAPVILLLRGRARDPAAAGPAGALNRGGAAAGPLAGAGPAGALDRGGAAAGSLAGAGPAGALDRGGAAAGSSGKKVSWVPAEQKWPPNVAAADIGNGTALVSVPPCMMVETKAKSGKRVSVCLDKPQAPGDEGCCTAKGGCINLGSGAMGRIGNRLSEMIHSLQFINATAAYRGVSISKDFLPWNLFQLPKEICLAGDRRDDPGFVWKQVPGCQKNRPTKNWDAPCEGVPSSEYLALVRKYVVPYLSDRLKGCLNATRGIDEDRLLTIHMRGEDIFGKWRLQGDLLTSQPHSKSVLIHRIIEQPPCALYEKVISEGSFNRVLFISTKELASPCFVWLKDYRNRTRNRFGQDVKVEIQTGSLLEDICAVLKARHFVLSGSSFAHNLMSVSQEVQTMYVEGGGLDSFHHLLMCPPKSHETNPFDLMTYDVPRDMHPKHRRGKRMHFPILPGKRPATTEAAVRQWMMELKVEDVHGPYLCNGGNATPF